MERRLTMSDRMKMGRFAAAQATGLKVGFYGCNQILVRVAWVQRNKGERAPTKIKGVCPACGIDHTVHGNFMFRKARNAEEFELCHVHLTPEE